MAADGPICAEDDGCAAQHRHPPVSGLEVAEHSSGQGPAAKEVPMSLRADRDQGKSEGPADLDAVPRVKRSVVLG